MLLHRTRRFFPSGCRNHRPLEKEEEEEEEEEQQQQQQQQVPDPKVANSTHSSSI